MTILACDVGNSRTKFGLLTTTTTRLPQCRRSATFLNSEAIDWLAIYDWLDDAGVESPPVVMAGAHPQGIREVIFDWPITLSAPPFQIQHEMLAACLPIQVDEPAKVGIDRLLNAVAANALRPDGCPAVIVDSGTATTVDVVNAEGAFIGGAILPGFELAARSLHEYTALLPYIGIEELAAEEPAAVGPNTAAAIRSGLYWGQIGAVTKLLEEMTQSRRRIRKNSDESVIDAPKSHDFADDPLVLLTGGGAEMLAEHIEHARREPHLTLQGLVLAFRHLRADRRPTRAGGVSPPQ